MRKIYLLFAISFFLTIVLPGLVVSQTWTKVGGTSVYINKIFFPFNDKTKLIVSSDDVPTNLYEPSVDFPHYGVGQNGYRVSSDGGASFGASILQDYSVYDFIQNPAQPNTWFAAVRQFTEGGIASSTDGGQTWGGTVLCSQSAQALSIAVIPGTPNTYFTASVNTNKGLKITTDNFTNCVTFDALDIQARNIKVSPLDKNMLFIAGDNSAGRVFRSIDGGNTWVPEESGLTGLRILSLLPSAWSKAVVYCGVDSVEQMTKESIGKGIYQSLDTGKTWHFVAAAGTRVYELAQNPVYPRYIAAACDSQGVMMSGSYGFGWERFRDGFSDTASVRHVAFEPTDSTNDGVVVYASSFGEGLYKSKHIKTAVEDEPVTTESLNIIKTYPNPVSSQLYLVVSTPFAGNFKVTLFDQRGAKLLVNEPELINSGEQLISINIPDYISSGTYLISLSDGIRTASSKVLIIK